MWQLKYYPLPGKPTTKTLGPVSGPNKLSKSEARREADAILGPLNADPMISKRATTLAEFVNRIYLPVKCERWRPRTAKDTVERIQKRILNSLGQRRCGDLEAADLRELLKSLRDAGMDSSTLNHVRSDLRGIGKLMCTEGFHDRDVSYGLQAPKSTKAPRTKQTVSRVEYKRVREALETRDRLALDLIMFCGLRQSEVYALRCGDISGASITIERSIYRGSINAAKTDRSHRLTGLPAALASELRGWIETLPANGPEAWLFPSILDPSQPIWWPDSRYTKEIKPKLAAIGLGWVTFAVVRRTYSTEHERHGTRRGLVARMQGHSEDVHANVYTQAELGELQAANESLYNAFIEVTGEDQEG